jgi:hypothetical protein
MSSSPNLGSQSVSEATKSLIVAALALTAGLAWNQAISKTVDTIWPNNANSLWALYIYAILVTIAIVLVVHFLLRIRSSDKDGSSSGKQKQCLSVCKD